MQQTRKTEKLASMQRSMDNKIHCNQQYALETRCYREKELDIMAATKKIEVETMIPFDSSATNERSFEMVHRINSLSFEMGTIVVEILSSSSSC